MRLQFCAHASELLAVAGPFLERNEVENNLILGILQKVQSTHHSPDQPAILFGLVQEADAPVLVFIMTPPHNLLLAGTGSTAEKAAIFLADHVHERIPSFPGIIGHPEIAKAFANAWCHAHGISYRIQMEQRIYRLNKVNDVPLNKGCLRLATSRELDQIAQWIYHFITEVGETITKEDASNKANMHISEAKLYVWDDGNGVATSMALRSRTTRHGIVIALVYTPPAQRNKGYATSCVAELSRLLLREGYQFCSLYTDLANPTSNHIYQTIGFEPVSDSIVYTFQA